MGYIDRNLLGGEIVVYRARLHWIVFAKPALIAAALAAAAMLSLYASTVSQPGPMQALRWAGGGLLVSAVIPLVVRSVQRGSVEFAVTTKRVVLKMGLLHNRTEEMFLHKIESVGVNQSVSGRALGYGAIAIRGTGGSLEPIAQVSSPLEFRRQIQEQIGRGI